MGCEGAIKGAMPHSRLRSDDLREVRWEYESQLSLIDERRFDLVHEVLRHHFASRFALMRRYNLILGTASSDAHVLWSDLSNDSRAVGN